MSHNLDFPRKFNPVFQHTAVEHLTYPLTTEELRTYLRCGYVIIRQALDAETIAELYAECDRLVAAADMSGRNLRYTDSFKEGATVPWKIDPCVDVSPVFYKLSRDRRICDRLASIYGGFNPRLFKDKMIIKPAGSGPHGLHQDYNWWQGFPGSLLSVTIPFDKTTRVNGCTELYTGYEQGFQHVHGELSGFNKDAIEGQEHLYLELDPGDIGIFHNLTPHSAGANESDDHRRVMFLSYNDSRDGEHRTSHYEHFFGYRTKTLSLEERRQLYW